ncbi:hypothetical protein Tco_0615328 [Tanacetum coccineum]
MNMLLILKSNLVLKDLSVMQNLNSENFCFTTELNKAFEPKTYWQACKEQHWIEAMNKEMDALYGNDTWDMTELPSDRKAIVSSASYIVSTSRRIIVVSTGSVK